MLVPKPGAWIFSSPPLACVCLLSARSFLAASAAAKPKSMYYAFIDVADVRERRGIRDSKGCQPNFVSEGNNQFNINSIYTK